LRFVLSQQRDHYLPLRVIKDQLEAIDRRQHTGPVRVVAPANAPASALTANNFTTAASSLRLTREELVNTAGLRTDQLVELEQHGLVSAGADGMYDDDALAVATVVCQLAQFGLEGRHLRSFKAAADREVDLFSQVATPIAKQRNIDGKARADEVVRELAALSVRLHTALVQIGLRDFSR
jgi:hypothetical protein